MGSISFTLRASYSGSNVNQLTATVTNSDTTDLTQLDVMSVSLLSGSSVSVHDCLGADSVKVFSYYPNDDRPGYVGMIAAYVTTSTRSNIFVPLAYFYMTTRNQFKWYYITKDGSFIGSDWNTSSASITSSFNFSNLSSWSTSTSLLIGVTKLTLGGNFLNARYNSVNYTPENNNVPMTPTSYVMTISSAPSNARLEIKKGTNGKSFQYDGGSENTSASYMLEIPSTGSHELTYNGVEPGLTELSVEVQNSEEIDVGYNDTWTSAPTTLTLTPSADTVTLRSNMQLTVTSENENIMDAITVNNEPQVTPYTGTITGTQNIVLKPTPPKITIKHNGTSTPVVSDT